jgi:hypothetical protein
MDSESTSRMASFTRRMRSELISEWCLVVGV